jgi:hypothetical protein
MTQDQLKHAYDGGEHLDEEEARLLYPKAFKKWYARIPHMWHFSVSESGLIGACTYNGETNYHLFNNGEWQYGRPSSLP